MKRKGSSALESVASETRRRQPQISCDFCRARKLKCDRNRPCSSCAARGRTCVGQPGPTANEALPSVLNADILERLRRLEEAVFASRNAPIEVNEKQQDDTISQVTPPRRTARHPSADIDYPYAGDSPASEHCDRFAFHVAPAIVTNGASSSTVTDSPIPMEPEPSRFIWLPSKAGALALLDDYLTTSQFFLGIVHAPSTRSLIENLYARLPDNPAAASTADVALVLAISGTAAFFWDRGSKAAYRFQSDGEAAKQSLLWRKGAWDLLDQAHRATSGSLEEVQARVILGDLIYHMEGCTSRFRRLQSCALAEAREISLHLVDGINARGGIEGRADAEEEAMKEVKRRLWWHLCSTDWLLSVMAGPLYGTYTVHPQHMRVHYPRNINDSELALDGGLLSDRPRESPTDTSYFLIRIRLAEVCRSVVDALPLGGSDIDQLPLDRVHVLRRLFDDCLAAFPPSFALDAPIPPTAPANLQVQRQVITLAFHARRARLFRPFLQPGIADSDARYAPFRALCLNSALAVLDIASELLRVSLDASVAGGRRPRPHRSGTVINHLFVACVVLVTDPLLGPGNEAPDGETEARRMKLGNACRLLEMAGRESPMAANLVQNLVGVLRRHRVHGVEGTGEQVGEEELDPTGRTGAGVSSGLQDWSRQNPDAGAVLEPHGHLGEWDSGQGEDVFGGLDGIWGDLMSVPMNDGWGQLFADLDHFGVTV